MINDSAPNLGRVVRLNAADAAPVCLSVEMQQLEQLFGWGAYFTARQRPKANGKGKGCCCRRRAALRGEFGYIFDIIAHNCIAARRATPVRIDRDRRGPPRRATRLCAPCGRRSWCGAV
jgi:hypothetical protein